MSGFNPALMSNKFQVSGLPTAVAVDGSFGDAVATGHLCGLTAVVIFCNHKKAPVSKFIYKISKIRAFLHRAKEAKQGQLIKG